MTTAHTPGSWYAAPVSRGAATDAPLWIHDDGGRRIADVREQSASTIANAHLIAAAPDLLAALREFLELSELAGDDDHQAYAPTMAKARAAIAKAGG